MSSKLQKSKINSNLISNWCYLHMYLVGQITLEYSDVYKICNEAFQSSIFIIATI